MNQQLLAFVALIVALAVAYRFLGAKYYGALQANISSLVPTDELRDTSDYRRFFALLNRFSENKLGAGQAQVKSLESCSRLGPFHFLSAFSNLTEIQREAFASNPEALQKVVGVFEKYNASVWNKDGPLLANSVANYYRAVKGEGLRESPTYSVTDQFLAVLAEAREALARNEIFGAHLIFQQQEENRDLTDLEVLILNYLKGKLAAYFQGKEYCYSTEANEKFIREIEQRVLQVLEMSKRPDQLICRIPGDEFAMTSQ